MSPIGGNPATAVVRPVGPKRVAAGAASVRRARSVGVTPWVLNAHETTMSGRVTPAAAAAPSKELVSPRSGSSAQALDAGSSGSSETQAVPVPLESGVCRCARK